MTTSFDRAWDLVKMPVIPGSLRQTHRVYEYGRPKIKMGFGPNPVEEGDESESDHFWYEARHTEDPQRSRWPPIDVSIQNYTDAWESTRPREGREMALSGSIGEVFAYLAIEGDYRTYDGSLLSQGER